MIILFFGQPGSGKTTLSNAFLERLKNESFISKNFIQVDGDEWREISNNKDYSINGRRTNLTSAYAMSKFLEFKGFIPILSMVSPYDDLRKDLCIGSKMMTIYLHYDTQRGKDDYFVNNFEVPNDVDLVLNTSQLSINDCVRKVISLFASKIKN
jgi:adenylylsulfate kinase